MDSDRHFRTSSTNSTHSTASGDLFICFTSRFSSMKISSKSILSPGRAREPSQISLSTSLSRRLKSSGSLKGGQASPMFPTGGKKRGCAFENPEPSSPKVTCIGQVRVKTKKQGKKMRARSLKRRGSNTNNNSEGSFRNHNQHLLRQNSNNGGNGYQQECISHRNQRWVHLPLTICEALRAFGAELNCFLPCNSSCSSNKESKAVERSSESGRSCGKVFARWLVAVQDNDGSGREIELVVEDEEDRTEKENEIQRRHVFEGLDFKEENEVVQEEESRISICIPPKNALLLMRCRSDPVKMAELAKRFCESPPPKMDEEAEEEHESKSDAPLTVTVIKEQEEEEETKTELIVNLNNEEDMSEEEEANSILQEEPIELATENEIVALEIDITVEDHSHEEQSEEEQEQQDENRIGQDNQQEKLEEETMAISIPIPISIPTCFETVIVLDAEKLESAEEDESKQLHGNEQEQKTEEEESKQLHGNEQDQNAEEEESKQLHGNEQDQKTEEDEDQRKELEDSENGGNRTSPSLPVETELVLDEAKTEVDLNLKEEVKETTATATDAGIEPETLNDDEVAQEKDQPTVRETPPPEPERETQTESSILPDCLLLMMYEPKLSMEVSKETWVCSTDFIRCVPTREKKAAPPQQPKKRETKPAESNTQAAVQPGRWSCSFPVAAAAAAMIEQKLVRAKGGYEPFALTRCKSEPMRSSAKPAPDACFWKDRKLEPHRPATFGVGAAGIGF